MCSMLFLDRGREREAATQLRRAYRTTTRPPPLASYSVAHAGLLPGEVYVDAQTVSDLGVVR